MGVLAAVALIAACSMPSDNQAQVITISEDHLGILDPAPIPESTTTTAKEDTLEVGLYFVEDDKLQRQPWEMTITRSRNLTTVLNQLLGGTTRQNFRSAIPPGVEIIDTRINESSRTATVVLLDNTLFSIEGNERLLAIAQVVFTATDRNGNAFRVDRVQFEIDRNLLTIPKGGGTDTDQPVGRCDYASYADFIDPERDCPSSTTTTTTSSTILAPTSPNGPGQ